MPKVKDFKVTKHTWFMKTHVGRNTLGKLTKKFTNDIPTLKGKWIVNKIGWGIVISRMEKFDTIEYGLMKFLRHHDAKSYRFFVLFIYLFIYYKIIFLLFHFIPIFFYMFFN